MIKNKKHTSNPKEVARLFEKRTGVKYQNWIQALSVTHSMNSKNLAWALLPKWIALITLLLVMIICVSCSTAPNGAFNHTPPLVSIDGEIVEDWPNHKPIDKYFIKDVREELHEYKLPVIMHSHTKLVQYCKRHYKWEVITAYWNPKIDDYDYLVAKHRREK